MATVTDGLGRKSGDSPVGIDGNRGKGMLLAWNAHMTGNAGSAGAGTPGVADADVVVPGIMLVLIGRFIVHTDRDGLAR